MPVEYAQIIVQKFRPITTDPIMIEMDQISGVEHSVDNRVGIRIVDSGVYVVIAAG